MTIFQVHLIMLGLALLVYLFLAGMLSNRKSYQRKLRRQWWIGTLAAIGVAASPLSRFWRNPETGIDLLTQSLLISAIFLLALMLFSLLFRPLSGMRRGKRDDDLNHENTNLAAQPSTVGAQSMTTPIVIDANGASLDNRHTDSVPLSGSSPDVTIDRSQQQSNKNADVFIDTHKVEKDGVDIAWKSDITEAFSKLKQDTTDSEKASTSKARAPVAEDVDTSVEMNSSVTREHENTSAKDKPAVDTSADSNHSYTKSADQANTKKLDTKEIESMVKMPANKVGTRQIDDGISLSNAANDNKSNDVSLHIKRRTDNTMNTDAAGLDTEKLDLSDTEQLFAEIRQQKSTVTLPDEDELRQAKDASKMDELDFDSELIQDADKRVPESNKVSVSQDIIEEAEVVDLDDTSLDFGNQLTGEYAHPADSPETTHTASVQAATSNTKPAYTAPTANNEVEVPATLEAAIVAAKVNALSLQSQVSNLETSISELDELRDSTIDATLETAAIRAEHSEAMLRQKDELLRSENEARAAAESVIEAQNALIERAKQDQSVVNAMLNKERLRLQELQIEVERSRKMARHAAQLARKAALAQQASKDIALREQTARLKSQESTRKAVTIARNAISALAAEERKHGRPNR